MGEIQGEGYECYRSGDMAWNEAKDNRQLIDKIITRLDALETQMSRVAELADAAPRLGSGIAPSSQSQLLGEGVQSNVGSIPTPAPKYWYGDPDYTPTELRAKLFDDLVEGLCHQIYRSHVYSEVCDGCRKSIQAIRKAEDIVRMERTNG